MRTDATVGLPSAGTPPPAEQWETNRNRENASGIFLYFSGDKRKGNDRHLSSNGLLLCKSHLPVILCFWPFSPDFPSYSWFVPLHFDLIFVLSLAFMFGPCILYFTDFGFQLLLLKACFSFSCLPVYCAFGSLFCELVTNSNRCRYWTWS